MWSFVLTNMHGEKIGEFTNAYERKYVANLSKPSTASFQVRRDHPFLGYLYNSGEDYLLQVWDGGTLRMWGPILTANLAMVEGQVPSVAITAADVGWRMGMRKFWAAGTGLAITTHDKGIIASMMLEYQNGRASMGIASAQDTCGNTGAYTAGPYKSMITCIQELSQGFDGFDWYIEPGSNGQFEAVTNAYPGGKEYLPTIGTFRCAGVIGNEKPNAVFEYGVGRLNMRSVNFLKDQTTRANLLLNVSEEGYEATPANPTPLVVKGVSTAEQERWGIYEDMAELSGVNNVALRENYTQEALNVRERPRRVLAMTSDIDDHTGRVPKFGTDYWLGDTVVARSFVNNVELFNGLTRVYSVEVALNNAGTATVVPILVEEIE